VNLPDRTVLENGAVLVSHALPSNPFIAFRGSVSAGVAAEGSDVGVAEFTSRLLLSGTRRRSASRSARVVSIHRFIVSAPTSRGART